MGGPDRGMGPGSFGDSQAMLAQRNSAMDVMERRSRAERERSGSLTTVREPYLRTRRVAKLYTAWCTTSTRRRR
jgi:hypothetical protein